MDAKLLKEDIKDRRDSCYTDLTEFLLKAGENDPISRIGKFSLN